MFVTVTTLNPGELKPKPMKVYITKVPTKPEHMVVTVTTLNPEELKPKPMKVYVTEVPTKTDRTKVIVTKPRQKRKKK